MRVIDIVNAPWALEPAKLEQLVAVYCAHLRGEKIDFQALEAQLGRPLDNTRAEEPYQILGGVAVIPIQGVISKRMNLFSRISGGVSSELVGKALDQALVDSRIHAIVLDIDSPGGAVDGTQSLADKVYAARSKMPIVAWGDGSLTSGAYWIGSAAEEVYLSGETVISGSIGVAMQHVDVSKNNEKFGVTVTDIYAGKYKRIASENKPLSDEGKASLQAIVDSLYSVFVDQVARNRGAESGTVLSNMADGRLFVGRAAIDAGLVDGVSTLDALIADLAAGEKPASSKRAKSKAVAG